MEHKTKQCIRLKFVIITGLMTGVLIALPGCISASSDMQSARMLGPQNIEVTHGFSSVHFDETGQPIEHSYNNFSVQLGKGVSDKMDFRLRYDYSWGKEPFWEDTSVIHIFSLGPKFSLLKNRRALYIPVGFVLGVE